MATNVLYLPDGPKNLEGLFPDIDFRTISEYFINFGDIVATPVYKIVKGCDDHVRVHFVNGLGAVDAISFCLQTKEHETKSDDIQRPLSVPLFTPDHGLTRINIKSNDTYTVVTDQFGEGDEDWLDELFDASIAWIELNAYQGQPDTYLPIKILDGKNVKRQEEDRYMYTTTVQFQLSAPRINIRPNVSQDAYTSFD